MLDIKLTLIPYFSSEQERLDILVNNAAVYTPEREETEDGFEAHMGVNHLGQSNQILEKLVFVQYFVPKIDFDKNGKMILKSSG